MSKGKGGQSSSSPTGGRGGGKEEGGEGRRKGGREEGRGGGAYQDLRVSSWTGPPTAVVHGSLRRQRPAMLPVGEKEGGREGGGAMRRRRQGAREGGRERGREGGREGLPSISLEAFSLVRFCAR